MRTTRTIGSGSRRKGSSATGDDESTADQQPDNQIADAHEDDHPSFDSSVAHIARVYNYWLGGTDNYAVDRAAGDAVVQAYPDLVSSVRSNRAFPARTVRYLAVRLAHARALLTSTPEGATDYLDADLRDTEEILAQAAQTLDFSRPVAIVLLAILHLIEDEDDPYGITVTLLSAVPPGSYLTLSHIASDITQAVTVAGNRVSQFMMQKQTYRDHSEVTRFFRGLEIVDPGVVRVQEWRPESAAEASAPSALWGAVARKPATS